MSEHRKRILEFLSQNGEKGIAEVAEACSLSKDGARYHLMVLASEGKVKRRRIGQRFLLYRITEDGRKTVKTSE